MCMHVGHLAAEMPGLAQIRKVPIFVNFKETSFSDLCYYNINMIIQNAQFVDEVGLFLLPGKESPLVFLMIVQILLTMMIIKRYY
jgi:hypothetical protein